MLLRRKTFPLLLCLFLIAFKVAASSIFVQAAIERAELAGDYSSIIAMQLNPETSDTADDNGKVHTMYLMHHVAANISTTEFTIYPPQIRSIQYFVADKVLLTQNFPDAEFKPPKSIA
jgi:hypothetical protein